ncbi:MAG TPA: hypothetical protein VLV78_20530 [Thermoanaerobaculia bacterium]|nr:hypothetical protein [Thermoanaerobaculia bacterium]
MRVLIVLLLAAVASANNQYPAVSRGSRIAFASDRDGRSDLHVMDADGGHLVRLTRTPEQEIPPLWSSDGRTLLFAVAGNDSTISSADLGRVVEPTGKVTDGSSAVGSPRCSPDRKTIAFTGRGADNQLHIYLMDADGSNVRQLTQSNPPDGQMQSDRSGQWEIWTMNADGTGLRQVTGANPR